jgi:expansin (peptidoglycan-binding protein)
LTIQKVELNPQKFWCSRTKHNRNHFYNTQLPISNQKIAATVQKAKMIVVNFKRRFKIKAKGKK